MFVPLSLSFLFHHTMEILLVFQTYIFKMYKHFNRVARGKYIKIILKLLQLGIRFCAPFSLAPVVFLCLLREECVTGIPLNFLIHQNSLYSLGDPIGFSHSIQPGATWSIERNWWEITVSDGDVHDNQEKDNERGELWSKWLLKQ